MTVNQITTSLAIKLNQEDNFTFKRAILTDINAWRGTLIEQTLKNTPADANIYMESMYVDMEVITSTEGIETCPVSRSIKKLPRAILYSYIGSIDGYAPFGTFTIGTERYLRFCGVPAPFADIQDDYLVVNNKRIKKVKLVGIPADPEEWYMFNCKPGDCDFWNSEYPAPEKICQRITQSILSVDFRRILPIENEEVSVNEPK